MRVALGDEGGDDALDARQQLVEARGVGLAGSGPAGQLGQLDAADGGGHVRHAVVEAHQLVGVLLLHALVADEAAAAGQLGVGRGDHAALEAGHVLGGVEGEGAPGPEGAHGLAVDGGAVRLGAVLEDGQAVTLGDGEDLRHVGGQTVEVDHLDGRRAFGDGGLDTGGVEGEGHRVDVGEDRHGTTDGHRVAGGGEGEGGDDDLRGPAGALLELSGQGGHVLGRGAGVDGHAVDAVDDLGGELLLEGLDLGPLDDHARGEDGVDGVALLLPDDRLGCWDELA